MTIVLCVELVRLTVRSDSVGAEAIPKSGMSERSLSIPSPMVA